MTKLLERAVAAAQKLPDSEQDAIAAFILDHIADDRAWDEVFARSHDQLSRFGAKVRDDIATGRVRSLERRET